MPSGNALPPIDVQRIRAAAERIRPHVHRTPVFASRSIDAALGFPVLFKAESLQKVGAFKARGAVNAVFSLRDDEARSGVGAHSSGNHGAALAYAASRRGIPCTVVIPRDAPAVKIAAVEGYGADVVRCEQPEREERTEALRRERGFVLIHPYEHPDVIAGQGTAALEFLEREPDLDALIAPVGGGGLLAGTTLAAKALRPDLAVFGAEPSAVDDAARSIESGVRRPAVANPQTRCDGLLTGLGAPNFAVLIEHGVRVLTVDEDEILQAARAIFQRMKLVVEPSAATVLAALFRHRERFAGRRVGAILSGGNTDFSWLPAALALPDLVAEPPR